jgi:hypothetical protein
MAIGITLFIIAVLIIAIWLVVELKRMRHKLFALFLIGLILFLYISATFVFKGQEIEWGTASGATKAANVYLSWLGSIFGNMKSITSYAIKMDWKDDEALENQEDKDLFNLSSLTGK